MTMTAVDDNNNSTTEYSYIDSKKSKNIVNI